MDPARICSAIIYHWSGVVTPLVRRGEVEIPCDRHDLKVRFMFPVGEVRSEKLHVLACLVQRPFLSLSLDARTPYQPVAITQDDREPRGSSRYCDQSRCDDSDVRPDLIITNFVSSDSTSTQSDKVNTQRSLVETRAIRLEVRMPSIFSFYKLTCGLTQRMQQNCSTKFPLSPHDRLSNIA